MARRIVDERGAAWDVFPSGRVTQYDLDQLSLEFVRVGAEPVERRFVRYAPRGAQVGELAFEQTSDRTLLRLLAESQVSWTSPDGGYTTA